MPDPVLHKSTAFQAPLMPIAAAIVAGILCDYQLGNPHAYQYFWLCLIVMASVAALLFGNNRALMSASLIILATGIGGLGHRNAFYLCSPDHIIHYTTPEPQLCRLRGTIQSVPETTSNRFSTFQKWQYSPDNTSFLLDIDKVETTNGFIPASGRARIKVRDSLLAARMGDRIEAFGFLYRPMPPGNPGGFDWALYQKRKGIHVAMTCSNGHCVRRLNSHKALIPWLQSFRNRCRLLLTGSSITAGDQTSNLLDAIILGNRSSLDDAVNDSFIRSGCAHFLAVSGMHVGMLALLVGFAARFAGLRIRGCAVLVFITCVIYAILVEPRPPIFRATVMITIICLALWFHRRPRVLNSLSLAAIILLVIHPTALFSAGFQLSFIAVGGILILTEPLATLLKKPLIHLGIIETPKIIITPPERSWQRTIARAIGYALCAGLAAWLATLPLVMFHFGRFSPWGWFNSLLVWPLVMLTMTAGFIQIIVVIISPTLAGYLAPLTTGSCDLLRSWVDILSRMPGVSINVFQPSWQWISLYYATLASFALMQHRPSWFRKWHSRQNFKKKDRYGQLQTPNPSQQLQIQMLPPSLGNAILLYPPQGGAILFDYGRSESRVQTNRLCAWLRTSRIHWLDLYIMACPRLQQHDDFTTIARNVGIGAVMASRWNSLPGYQAPGRQELIRRIQAMGIAVAEVDNASQQISINGMQIEFLWPPANSANSHNTRTGALVCRMSSETSRILLCGRLDDDSQAWLASSIDTAAQWLFLPASSSIGQSTPRFIYESGIQNIVCGSPQSSSTCQEHAHLKGLTDLNCHAPEEQQILSLKPDAAQPEVQQIDLPRPRKYPTPEKGLTAILLAAFICLTLFSQHQPSRDNTLTMTVLNVGKGLSVVLELPDGETLLYDAGGSGGFDPAEQVILPYLRHRKIDFIDSIILSHPNLDHYCGLPTLLSNMPCGNLRLNPTFPMDKNTDTPWALTLNRIPDIPILFTSANDTIRYGDVTIETIWPPGSDFQSLQTNDTSTVIKLHFQGIRILLTGDIEQSAQETLIAEGNLRAEILLAPHHGSMVSQTREFLNAVKPECMILSTSARRENTVAAFPYTTSVRQILSTEDQGAISIRIHNERWSSEGFRTE